MASRTLRVIAHFRDEDGRPLVDDDLRVALYDEDAVTDDKLGEVTLDASGTAIFDFAPEAMRSFDSPLETQPDLYFVVTRDGIELLRTEVFGNVEFKPRHASRSDEHVLVRAFGPFHVESDI